jgi:hypothetical protein
VTAGRSRWKTIGYAAELALVLVFALIAAPRFPLPKPAVEAPKRTKPPRVIGSDWGNSTPLGDDLKRGRWKSGDRVEDVLASYNGPVSMRKHGEFTTITEPNFTDDGYYQLVAMQGRLKAAYQIPIPYWLLRFSGIDEPPRHSYFDTLTKEERVAHDASYKLALAISYAVSPYGRFSFLKAFVIGPGKLSSFGR